MIYNDDLEIIFDETLIREEDEDNINESNISEYEENDIKNLPSKLNNIYDDIKIIDDGNEENDINLVKYNDLNIINLDTIRNEEKENNQINQNINDINKINIYQNTNTKPNLKKKKKKKHNINTNLDLSDDKIANLILQKRKEIDDISNMLEHFKTKTGIEDNIQNLNELRREFGEEIKKYFN